MAISRRHFLQGTGAALLGGSVAAPLSLAQATADPEEPAWSFVAVGCPHLREDEPFRVPKGAEGMTAVAKFERVLERMQDLRPAPAFMLMLGDIHPEKLEPILPDIPVPIHAIAGNHERPRHRAQLREMFADDFQGRDFYAFEHRDALLIGMCNAVPGDHVGYFEAEGIEPAEGQREWIEAQLRAGASHRHCIVFGHVPPHPEPGVEHQAHLAPDDAAWLRQRVERHRPSALFFAHRHRQLWFNIAETPVYSLRSCNWNFDPLEPLGFVHVKVFADRLEVGFIATSRP